MMKQLLIFLCCIKFSFVYAEATPLMMKLLNAGDAPSIVESFDCTRSRVEYLKKPELKYPKYLNQYGNQGEALLRLAVSADGKPVEVTVLKSSNWGFAKAAIDAIIDARFIVENPSCQASGLVLIDIPLSFSLQDDFLIGKSVSSGIDAYELKGKPSDSLPDDFRFDVAPKPKLAINPVYPLELLKRGEKGQATVSFIINPEGNVQDVEVFEASRPEFGQATKAMIYAWKFEPAQKDGKPAWAYLRKQMKFDKANRDTWVSESTAVLLENLQNEKKFLTINALDHVPQPIHHPLPQLPSNLVREFRQGRVVVEFIIDQDGWVQLPKVIGSVNNDLDWIALTAVSRWRFDIPTQAGRPVDVLVQMPILFSEEDNNLVLESNTKLHQ